MRSRNRYPLLGRVTFFSLLSIALLFFNKTNSTVESTKGFLSVVNIPVEYVAATPKRLYDWFYTYVEEAPTDSDRENLADYITVLEAKLQRLEALEKENQRLSRFVSFSKEAVENLLLAEINDISFEPYFHKIVLRQGSEMGVYKGQAVITPQGVLGQVAEVGYKRSVVIAITDSISMTPVEILRNGLRAIAQGSSHSNFVNILFLGLQSDIQVGDMLVTSGLGEVFPQGYKVAEVVDIINDTSRPFLIIQAKTFTQFNTAREVLLIQNNTELSSEQEATTQ